MVDSKTGDLLESNNHMTHDHDVDLPEQKVDSQEHRQGIRVVFPAEHLVKMLEANVELGAFFLPFLVFLHPFDEIVGETPEFTTQIFHSYVVARCTFI